jgi:hypothetical protein
VRRFPAVSIASIIVPLAPVPLTNTLEPSGDHAGSNSSAELEVHCELSACNVDYPDVIATL